MGTLSEKMEFVGQEAYLYALDVAALEAHIEELERATDNVLIAEAITWLNHLENEGDHTHLGLPEFIAALRSEEKR
jgi:hypothetical protein